MGKKPIASCRCPQISLYDVISTKKTPQEIAQDTRCITKSREVVHTLGPAGTTTSDYHWSFYLILEPNQGSIHVNMRAEPGYIDGILDWTAQAYYIYGNDLRDPVLELHGKKWCPVSVMLPDMIYRK